MFMKIRSTKLTNLPEDTEVDRVGDLEYATDDFNGLSDPANDVAIDWDVVEAKEEADEPVEIVTLKAEDFISPATKMDMVDIVQRVIQDHLKQPLGGELVATTLKQYTILTVQELEAIENNDL
jgi:hypothetical protein